MQAAEGWNAAAQTRRLSSRSSHTRHCAYPAVTAHPRSEGSHERGPRAACPACRSRCGHVRARRDEAQVGRQGRLAGWHAGWLTSIGIRPGLFWAWVVILAEAGGGVLTILGLGGPIGPGIVAGDLVVAIIVAHISKGFWASQGGWEFLAPHLRDRSRSSRRSSLLINPPAGATPARPERAELLRLPRA